MNTKIIPASGEPLPVIGLGTWQTFDVDPQNISFPGLKKVLSLFVKEGGSLIDSSPMYGKSEQAVGSLLEQSKLQTSVFLATKVWCRGREAGIAQMKESLVKLKTNKIDLMQIHNLVDWRTHLPILNAWKAEGKIKYTGVTHYHEGAYTELEKVLKKEKIDFLQINYSLRRRVAEERLLPLAMDKGIAVLINQPFENGSIFSLVKEKVLPDFAKEFDCTTWGAYFLKFVLSHKAVTCSIPATANTEHLLDNLRAGSGRLPEEPLRKRMIDYVLG